MLGVAVVAATVSALVAEHDLNVTAKHLQAVFEANVVRPRSSVNSDHNWVLSSGATVWMTAGPDTSNHRPTSPTCTFMARSLVQQPSRLPQVRATVVAVNLGYMSRDWTVGLLRCVRRGPSPVGSAA